MITYIYVDGESHFIRSEAQWQKINGDGARLESAAFKNEGGLIAIGVYPAGGYRLLINRPARFFWDTTLLRLTRSEVFYSVGRAVYFTAAAGDDSALHRMRVDIRGHGFDPEVLPERKPL